MVDDYGFTTETKAINARSPGSVDGVDLEYTPKPERVICAAEERHADQDKRIGNQQEQLRQHEQGLADHSQRITALELMVHRLLNPDDDEAPSTKAAYAHIPTAEWEDICDKLEAARAADVPMLRRMIDGQHKVASERIEEIARLSSELRDLRAKWESVPWRTIRDHAVLIEVYGREIPGISANADETTLWVRRWVDVNKPKEAAE